MTADLIMIAQPAYRVPYVRSQGLVKDRQVLWHKPKASGTKGAMQRGIVRFLLYRYILAPISTARVERIGHILTSTYQFGAMAYKSSAVRLEMRAMWGSGDSNLLILANIRGEAPRLEET